jgi:hypothetical protein
MRFKFLRDVLIQGVTHKAGEIHQINDTDKTFPTTIEMCIGHGVYIPVTIGTDIELLDSTISSNDYAAALRVYQQYAEDTSCVPTPDRSPFTVWCETQLFELNKLAKIIK